MRYALIETFDGRDVLVPNDELINTRITNWTYSTEHARIDIKVLITYDSDPHAAREALLAAARGHPSCQSEPAPSCFLREFTETGMQFLLTFWIPNVRDGRFGPQSEVMLEIIRRFRAEGIRFSHDPQRAGQPAQPA
jgi:small-conductance mechanosensitive channel